MIVDIKKLLDFESDHCFQAEAEVQKLICKNFGFEPGVITLGNNPDFDFSIQNTTVELKFTTYDPSCVEVEFRDKHGRPSALCKTKADIYAFFCKISHTQAKLHIVKTSELLSRLLNRDGNATVVKTLWGATAFKVNILSCYDLGIATCNYNDGNFDLSTFKVYNQYVRDNIYKYIT